MTSFKEKAETHKKMLDELKRLKEEKVDSEELLNVFTAGELDTFRLKAHEPFRDFSGAVVSGVQYTVDNLPFNLKKAYAKETEYFLKVLVKQIEDLENQIETLENS